MKIDDLRSWLSEKKSDLKNRIDSIAHRNGDTSDDPGGETRVHEPIASAPEGDGATRRYDALSPEALAQEPPKKAAKPRRANSLVVDEEDEAIFMHRSRQDNWFLSIVVKTVKVSVAAVVLIIAAGLGAVAGVATAYLDSAPELDIAAIEDQAQTSYLYDSQGREIAIYTGLENRDWAALSEIPYMLQKAVISVEDARFYSHNGMDIKRTVGSFISNLTSSSVQGGSTLTQQLIKNQLLSSERSYKRKLQEAYLAMELEERYSKDQILEAYLNTIPLGGIVYGVKMAAKTYFDKELSELTLRECACIAGITQYPTKYSPHRVYFGSDDAEETAKRIADLDFRTDTVLVCMYEEGYITYEQLKEAEADELNVVKTEISSSRYDMPHFIEYAIRDITDCLLEQRGLADTTANRQAIDNELRTKGYEIHLTIDTAMQNAVQETLAGYEGYPDTKDKSYSGSYTDSNGVVVESPQAAAVVIDHRTGHIKALVGSRTEPQALKTFNRAVDSRIPVGSTIKPIAVYGPAFDNGAGLATISANIPVPIEGWDSEKGYPTTSQGEYGPTPLRTAIVKSLNIVAARTLMESVGIGTAADYLEKLGVDPSHIDKTGYGLAMGGSTVTPLELAGAYAAIANGGMYVEPVSFTKVLDDKGSVILDAAQVQESRRVFKKSTAYMLTDALTEAASTGTGRRAKIDGITTAGKTGTNEGNKGMFFAGFTGYYTSAVWVGHDMYVELESGSSAATVTAPLWNLYMTAIHQGLGDRAIITGSAAGSNAVKVEVCSVSGMLPGANCKTTVADYMAKSDAPDEKCTWHVSATICSDTGMPAGEYCPDASQNKSGAAVVLPGGSPYLRLEPAKLAELFPNLKEGAPCTLHTKTWSDDQAALKKAVDGAKALLKDVKAQLEEYGDQLSADAEKRVEELVSALEKAVKDAKATANSVNTAAEALRKTAERTFYGLEPEPTPKPTPTPEPTPEPQRPEPDDPGLG